MKNHHVNKVLRRISLVIKSYSSLVLCLFSIYVGTYAVISHFVFHNFNFPLNYMLYIFVIAVVVAVVLYGLLKIDKLSNLIQSLLIYVLIALSIYIVGFLTDCFTMNLAFWISTLIINLICATIVTCVILYRSNKVNEDLNSKLKSFKERDSK